MTTIAFDIEVAGLAWEEIDEITRGYLLNRARDAEEREAVPERTSLIPGLGRVIAIGLWNLDQDRGLLLLEGESEPERDWEKVARSQVFRGSERELLAKFWEVVARKEPQLVSYNGRGYDGPILMIRSAQLGLAPSAQLVPYRYDLAAHCDLQEVLSFHGALRPYYSLDFWCRRFDIESPKGSIDGSQIGRVYRQGGIEEIGEYCLRDVRATALLYQKLRDTVLPLFRGG